MDAFKVYEDGKHRRYTLIFSVNTAVAAILELSKGPLPSIERVGIALGAMTFTILITYDIWIFGQRIRLEVGDDLRNPLI